MSSLLMGIDLGAGGVKVSIVRADAIGGIGVSGGAHIGVLTDDEAGLFGERSCGATRAAPERRPSSAILPMGESSNSR